VFCGIDVGKTKHYAVALAPDGRRLLGKEIDNDEGADIRDHVTPISEL
jgi:hypothetical protein